MKFSTVMNILTNVYTKLEGALIADSAKDGGEEFLTKMHCFDRSACW